MAASSDLEAGSVPAPPRPAANGSSAVALPQLTPTAPSSSGDAAADEPRLGWWARLNHAVKKLKREVLALHYAIQVGAQPEGARHWTASMWQQLAECNPAHFSCTATTEGF